MNPYEIALGAVITCALFVYCLPMGVGYANCKVGPVALQWSRSKVWAITSAQGRTHRYWFCIQSVTSPMVINYTNKTSEHFNLIHHQVIVGPLALAITRREKE